MSVNKTHALSKIKSWMIWCKTLFCFATQSFMLPKVTVTVTAMEKIMYYVVGCVITISSWEKGHQKKKFGLTLDRNP